MSRQRNQKEGIFTAKRTLALWKDFLQDVYEVMSRFNSEFNLRPEFQKANLRLQQGAPTKHLDFSHPCELTVAK